MGRCCVTGGTEEHDWGEIVPAHPCVSAGARGEDHGDAFGDGQQRVAQPFGESRSARVQARGRSRGCFWRWTTASCSTFWRVPKRSGPRLGKLYRCWRLTMLPLPLPTRFATKGG